MTLICRRGVGGRAWEPDCIIRGVHLGRISYLGTYTQQGQSEATAQAHGPGPPNRRAPPEHDGGACGFIGRLSQTLFRLLGVHGRGSRPWHARLHYLPLTRTSEPATIYGFRDTGASSSRSCAGPGLPCERPTEPPARPSCSRWLDVVTGIGRIWTRRATETSRRATHSWLLYRLVSHDDQKQSEAAIQGPLCPARLFLWESSQKSAVLAPDPCVRRREVTSPLVCVLSVNDLNAPSVLGNFRPAQNCFHKYQPSVWSCRPGCVSPRHQVTRLLSIHTGSGTDHATSYQ